MFKLLKKVLYFIIIVAIILILILTISGYSMYKSAIKEISLDDKIANLEENLNYAYYEELPENYINYLSTNLTINSIS